MEAFPENPVLVEQRRGGRVETQHRGALSAIAGGEWVARRGDVEHPIFVRSAVKPLQAIPLVESGAADRFGLGDEDLALVSSSHNGEDIHAEGVARLLARAGLDERALACGTHPSLDRETEIALRCRGVTPSPLRHNCSGKHAGMLLLARRLGAPLEGYLDPDHPAQRLVRETVGALCGEEAESLPIGVDGCGAPAYAIPLRSLALGFRRLTTPEGLPSERRRACERIVAAIASHPYLLAGRGRLDTDLLVATGGRVLGKIGAEGVYAAGLVGGGAALALKIDDGSPRAIPLVLLQGLRAISAIRNGEEERLCRHADRVLRNHAGLPVGEIRVLA